MRLVSRTAARTLDLLEHVARAPGPAGLIELAGDTGIDKSTAARLLAFLAERELVVRDPVTRRYAPGPALLALGAAALQRSDLRAGARPYLERLRAATGETVTLHVRVADAFVCIDGLEGTSPIRRAVPLGESIPLYVGVDGKAILAFLRAGGDRAAARGGGRRGRGRRDPALRARRGADPAVPRGGRRPRARGRRDRRAAVRRRDAVRRGEHLRPRRRAGTCAACGTPRRC